MAVFGKKEGVPAEQPAQPASPSGPPVQEVMTMKSQGLNNNQIIQNLQREGYKSHQIFDAMNQADLHLAQSTGSPATQQSQPGAEVPSVSEPEMSPYYEKKAQPWPGSSPGLEPLSGQQPPTGAGETIIPPQQPPAQPVEPLTNKSPFDEGQAFGLEQPPAGAQPQPFAAPSAEGPAEAVPTGESGDAELDRIEEVAEAIIDEKWSELMKHIQKVIEWKERVDARIVEMENQFKNLQEEFDKLHENILGKIAEYDQNIRDVGTEIKGMEKVFQKIIPELTTNVSELSKLTSTIKNSTIKKEKEKKKKATKE